MKREGNNLLSFVLTMRFLITNVMQLNHRLAEASGVSENDKGFLFSVTPLALCGLSRTRASVWQIPQVNY
jgi:hypothetical protein